MYDTLQQVYSIYFVEGPDLEKSAKGFCIIYVYIL